MDQSINSSKIKNSSLFNVMPLVANKPWSNDVNLCRKIITLLYKIEDLTHPATPKYLFKIKMKENPFCDCGENIVGDLNHITLGCKLIKIILFTKFDFSSNYLSQFGIPYSTFSIIKMNYLI